MNDALYLPFDTETGGIGDDVSLLSAHFAACDKDFNILDELDLLIKPDDGLYKVQAEALVINKINLIEHDKIALPYSKAGGALREFLWKHSKNGKIKLIPVGKNITFDVVKVTTNILGPKSFNQFVSYRHYDITTMVILLKRIGKLPADGPDSLEKLAHYFGIPIDAHTAKGDNYAGIEVVKRLEGLVKL